MSVTTVGGTPTPILAFTTSPQNLQTITPATVSMPWPLAPGMGPSNMCVRVEYIPNGVRLYASGAARWDKFSNGAMLPSTGTTGAGSQFVWMEYAPEEWPLGSALGGGDPTPAINAFHEDFNAEFAGRGHWLQSLGEALLVNPEIPNYGGDGALAKAIQQMRDIFNDSNKGFFRLYDLLAAFKEDAVAKLGNIEGRLAPPTGTPPTITARTWDSGLNQAYFDSHLAEVATDHHFVKPDFGIGTYDPNIDLPGPGTPPDWTFTVPIGQACAALGVIGVNDFDVHADWSPLSPYVGYIHIFFQSWTLMSCVLMVWSEFRKQ